MAEITLKIPDKWQDITIATYQKYVKIQEAKGSEKNKVLKSLALLCDTTTAVVKKMAYKDLLEIMGIIKTMVDTEPENLHIIMSILYRKITFKRNERYAIENYNPDEFKEELFKDCPMDIALNSLGFFLTLGSVLAKTSVHYLKAQETKQQKA